MSGISFLEPETGQHRFPTKSSQNFQIFEGKRLLVILACPPITSGKRTLNQMEALRAYLNFSTIQHVNMNVEADLRTSSKNKKWDEEESWLEARTAISRAVNKSDCVLLAYGVQKPSGSARHFHSDQVIWLHKLLRRSDKTVFQIGNKPRHPSRWHRKTLKTQEQMSTMEAVLANIQMIDLDQIVPTHG